MAAFKKQVYTERSRGERSRSGFTLVELMITLAIMAVVAGIIIFIISPQRQLQKARDARRKDDLNQISQALGQYALANNNDYPVSTVDYQITGAPWNSSWQPYLVKVPQDPLPSQTYAYQSDGKSYQLYARLENPDANGCSPCGPGGLDNYGITSSSNTQLTSLPPAPSPTPTIAPTATPSPTPIPKHYVGDITVSISSQNNPQMMQATINPFDPNLGDTQSFSLYIRDTSGSYISSVKLTVNSDSGSQSYDLSLLSGSNTLGTWSVNIKAPSYEKTYTIKFTAVNSAGVVSVDEIPLELSLANLRASQP